jgi:transcriptional regulator with XRE-family HTH domain
MSTVLQDDDAKQNVAENLRTLMAETGVTQKEISEATEISPMSISYYLKAERMAGGGPLARLAEYFGVSVDYLLKKPTRKKSQKSA